jgi:hypothetical protein
MTTPCDQCRGPLFPADVLSGLTTCCECARRALHAMRKGTRAVHKAFTLRDQGQAQATDAHPDERAKVEAAIRQLAATGQPFSANTCRDLHGVNGGIVGATFTAMRKAGLIERIGREPSTSAATHGHEIGQWRGVQGKETAA